MARPATLRFGPYLVDLATGELRKNGLRLRLQEKPLRVLVLLAERQGQLVTREDLRKYLWPEDTFVDFETGLNTAVSKLREALSDSAEKPRYIETMPRRGYRFIAEVEAQAHAQPLTGLPATPGPVSADPGGAVRSGSGEVAARPDHRFSAVTWFGGMAAAVILLLLLTLWWVTPLPEPRLLNTFAITANGKQDFLVRPATDGGRIFYVQRAGDHYELMQIPVTGGEPRKMEAPFRNSLIWDVSADGTHYLLTSFAQRGQASPLWSWPTTGGAPVKLDNLISGSATWSPDGRWLAFHNGHDLLLANADGSEARVVHTFREEPDSPDWAPDSKVIRFTLNDTNLDTHTIWQMRPDGTELHEILPDWPEHSRVCCGTWSPDGRYYVFAELGEHRRLWAVREKGKWWRRSPRGPFLLSAGPRGSISPLMGKDGAHIYFYGFGVQESLELLDRASHQFAPVLGDVHAIMPSFSRDGQWLAYVRPETGALWVSRLSGQEAREIFTPGLSVAFPRWSPDGLTLVFAGRKSGEPTQIYTVEAQGGHLEALLRSADSYGDPDWAPDGASVIATRQSAPNASGKQESVLNLIATKSGQAEEIPESSNLSGGRWSPDGRVVAAVSQATQELKLYDVPAKKWRTIAHGQYIGLPEWSRDGKYLYFQDLLAPGEPLFRWSAGAGAVEEVADFQKTLESGVHRCAFIGLTAAGEPVIGLQRGVSDIYGASVALP